MELPNVMMRGIDERANKSARLQIDTSIQLMNSNLFLRLICATDIKVILINSIKESYM